MVFRQLFAYGSACICFVLFSGGVAKAQPLAGTDPVLGPAVYEKAYIPYGFDSNDNVQIVLEGTFPSLCWRPANVTVSVDPNAKTITVGPAGYLYQTTCGQVTTQFHPVVDLGLMPEGTYKLIQQVDGKVLGEIPIDKAVIPAPDDFLYAPVSQAYYSQQRKGAVITLSGSFPSDCMVMDDVVVHLQTDVIIVQPIAKLLKSRTCSKEPVRFERRVTLKSVPRGRYMLHIRSMNAQAINTMVDQL